MAKISIIDGPDVGAEYDLPDIGESTPSTVGRDTRVEIQLSDPAVSREHFRFERGPRGWRVVDLGSRNQTFLNGELVRESALAHGDVVRIGDTELRFDAPETAGVDDAPGSTIIKEFTARPGETFLERIDKLERMVQEDKAQRALAEVRKLFELHTRISGTSSIEDFFRNLLAEVVPVLKADNAAVLLPEGDGWSVRASFPGTDVNQGAVSQSVVDHVVSQGKALLLENSMSDEKFQERTSIVDKEITTVLAIPVPIAGKVGAVIYADRRGAATPFLTEDLQLLTAALESIGPVLERLLSEERLRSENRNLFKSITDSKQLVGKSPAVEASLEFIRRAAPTPMTVLIQGETGTGKELVASAVHYASSRRGRPFIVINCAALPENLVESELFGHEKGAFTGALARRKGRFELAHRGTLFLDEVSEMTLACQAKLLRLLEERKFERVGGSESIQVDVRVVAATNRNLLEAVDEGTFREDLYYRLSVLNIELPPLRDRREDLPLLVEHFLRERCGTTKKLSNQAEKKLLAYNWPGNVRQLRNVIESAVVLGTGDEIRPEDLVLPPPRRARKSSTEPPVGADGKPMSLQDLERAHIQHVLEHTGGNKKRTAEILGIERCTLYAKIKSYKL
ncbi:MAG: sigma 54-interacting transcriptional regulator [Planctomycetota bacterium]|nr:sigma 54-interacting transcriptional regulator [Planctomycetota bacterium]